MSQRVPFNTNTDGQAASDALATRPRFFPPRTPQRVFSPQSEKGDKNDASKDKRNSTNLHSSDVPEGGTRKIFKSMARQSQSASNTHTEENASATATLTTGTKSPFAHSRSNSISHDSITAKLPSALNRPTLVPPATPKSRALNFQLPKNRTLTSSNNNSLSNSTFPGMVDSLDSDEETLYNEDQAASLPPKVTGGKRMLQSVDRTANFNALPQLQLANRDAERMVKRRKLFHAQQPIGNRPSMPLLHLNNLVYGGGVNSPITLDDSGGDSSAVHVEAKVEIQSPKIRSMGGAKAVANCQTRTTSNYHPSSTVMVHQGAPPQTNTTRTHWVEPFPSGEVPIAGIGLQQYIATHTIEWEERKTHWMSCSSENWLAGGDTLVEAFGKLFDRVLEGFEADMHSFDALDDIFKAHRSNVLDKREEMLRQVRESIMAGSGSILSTPL